MKKQTRQKNLISNKGFTLVELVIVLVLMSILLSITVFGTLGWLDWIQFRSQNNAAEDIFYAAQNQLTELDSSGAMYRRVQSVLMNDPENPGKYNDDYVLAQGTKTTLTKAFPDGMYDSDGNMYQWKNLWTDSNFDRDSRTIIKLCVPSGSYTKYAADRTSADVTTEARLLFDLIAPYISDKSVLDGAISIEFSPEAGQVFAVCYSDQVSTFTYDADTDRANSLVNIKDRKLHTREEYMVGYFGVDSLTSKIQGRSKDFNGYRFEIDNGTVLKLTLSKQSDMIDSVSDVNLTYKIQGAYDYNNDGKPYSDVMEFTLDEEFVNGLIYGNSQEFAIKNPSSIDVTFKDGLYKDKTINMLLPIWIDEYGSVNVILDAADIQAQSLTYATAYGVFSDDSESDEVKDAQEAFQKTFSFYRFALPNVRFITASISVVESDGTTGVVVAGRSNQGVDFQEYSNESGKIHGEAVTFANWEDGDSDNTYGIRNGRHLYNVRFETDYSDTFKTLSSSDPAYVPADRTRIFILKEDINWIEDFVGKSSGKNYFYNSKSSINEGSYGINLLANNTFPEFAYNDSSEVKYPSYDTTYYPFPSFRVLPYGDSFTQIADFGTDEFKRLGGLNISFAANCVYGIYGEDIRSSIITNHSSSYADISKQGAAGALPLGLFAESYGSIKGIEIDNITVKGIEGFPISNPSSFIYTSKVGSFVGENFGSVEKLYIDVFEDVDSNNNKIENYSYICGRTDIGGIIGHQYYITNDKQPDDVKISGCINNAKVTGLGYVGGIIGRIYSSGKSSFDVKYTDDYSIVTDSSTTGIKYFSDNYISAGVGKDELSAISKFTIDNCKNYGEVSFDGYFAENKIGTSNFKRGFYFGGITGAALNDANFKRDSNVDGYTHNNVNSYKVIISNCESYTLYTESELEKIVKPSTSSEDEMREAKRRFKANFVGGIVGGARYAYIDKCSNTPKASSEGEAVNGASYVFGDRYVGGIAGYMAETDVSGGQEYTATELGKITTNSAGYRNDYALINGTGVFGNYAVGGIAGAFGRPAGIKYVIGDDTQGEFVGLVLERAFGSNENSNYYQWPFNSMMINGSTCYNKGLLNTAPVMGLSYDSDINKSIYRDYEVSVSNGSEKFYSLNYGVGGIAGLLASKIGNADNIQTEETKLQVIKLAGFQYSTASDVSKISVSNLQKVIDSSSFATDGVGGIVGDALGGGDINRKDNNTKLDSRIDSIVFGRNRIGGGVGDTSLIEDRYGQSIIANLKPYRLNADSSGMYVLGQDNVGGFIGVYAEMGGNSGRAGFNDSEDFDGYVVKGAYYVIGNRAVGGAIGSFYDKQSDTSNDLTINLNITPDSGKTVYVKGSMYVGGIVGLQERLTGQDKKKYCLNIKTINVSGDCFVGGIAGALYSNDGYWPVDRLIDDTKNEKGYNSSIGSITVNAKMCAGLITGLYAYNDYCDTLLYNRTPSTGNDTASYNLTPLIITKEDGSKVYRSKNGIYAIDNQNQEVSDINDLIYGISQQDEYSAYINNLYETFDGVTNGIIINDLSELCNNVQLGGGNGSVITADVFVGGLFGFVPEKMPVTVVGFRNRAKLKTLKYINRSEIAVSDNNRYSYLGGVTGRVAEGMTLDRCRNTSGDVGDSYIASNASYKGEIAEINAGTIKNSWLKYDYTLDEITDKLHFFGTDRYTDVNNTANYAEGSAGGIVGVNGTMTTDGKNNGVIENCVNLYQVKGKTAGGIAAIAGGNSTIKGCKNHAAIVSSRRNGVGGAAGILYDVSDAAQKVVLEDNVNTGLVQDNYGNKNYSAGIVYNTKNKGEIKLCRNYANGLGFAITSSEIGKEAKTIQYCLDGSATTFSRYEESSDYQFTGFGRVVDYKTEEDEYTGNMKANMYIGKEELGGGEGLGVDSPSDGHFVANQLYSGGYEYYSPDNSSWTELWAPIKNYSVTLDEGEPIDDLVIRSQAGEELVHEDQSVWDLYKTDSAGNTHYLTFELKPALANGVTSNVYSNIKSISIVWDNYIKTKSNLYYKPYTDLNRDSDLYKGFAGDEYQNHNSFKSLAKEYGDLNSIDNESANMYGYATYIYMVNNDNSEDGYLSSLDENGNSSWTSDEIMTRFNQLLEDNYSLHPMDYTSVQTDSYYECIREYYPEIWDDSTWESHRRNIVNAPLYESYETPFELSFLDLAIREFNYGTNESTYAPDFSDDEYETYLGYHTYYHHYYNAVSSRDSYMSPDQNIDLQKYAYSTYCYMLSQDDVPSDSDALKAYYIELLYKNAETYGIRYFNSKGDNAQYQLMYNVNFYDINNKVLSIGQIETDIGHVDENNSFVSDFRGSETIDLEKLMNLNDGLNYSVSSADTGLHDIGYTSTTDANGVTTYETRQINTSVNIYKDADFDNKQIKKVVIFVTNEYAGSDNNDGVVGIRSLSWDAVDDEGNDLTLQKVDSNAEGYDMYREAIGPGPKNTIIVLDKYNQPMQKLYFKNYGENDPDTSYSPELYLYQYPTYIRNISVNKEIRYESQHINLLNEESPVYFSEDYINNTSPFDYEVLSDQEVMEDVGKNKSAFDGTSPDSTAYRYYFYKEVDSKFRNLIISSGVYK